SGGRKQRRRCRWFEIKIETWQSAGDPLGPAAYRVTIAGRTRVSGEVDRVTVESTSSPARVLAFLALGPPGAQYIPRISRLALSEVGEWEPRLADAIARFDRQNKTR